MERWQKDIEELLSKAFPDEGVPSKEFPDDGSPEMVRAASEALAAVNLIVPPSGAMSEVIAEMMKQASKRLCPLSAMYLGFHLGVAWQRLNAV